MNDNADPALQWARFLCERTGRAVSVRFGRARTAALRYQRDRTGALVVTMNAFFVQAPESIRESVGAWVRAGRRARKSHALLREWIESELMRLEKVEPRRVRLQSRGRVHDLGAIAAPLWNEGFADGTTVKPSITWGLHSPIARRRRSMRLGSYHERAHVVRVHPALDQAFVPEWFVRYILFHEFLHASLGVKRGGNRRILHGAEFRRREREYPDYARAIAWERRHLRELLVPLKSGCGPTL